MNQKSLEIYFSFLDLMLILFHLLNIIIFNKWNNEHELLHVSIIKI